MLRCGGCGVLHHPACWVRHGGCATQRPHESAPSALAFTGGAGAAVEPPHPGEGTRRFERPGESLEAVSESDSAVIPLAEAAPLAAPPTRSSWRPPPEPAAPPPAARRMPRATPPPADLGGPVQHGRYTVRATPEGKPLPEIYGRHRFLRLWYIPVAAIVAVLVAAAVIWAGERVFGGSDAAPAFVPQPTVPVPTLPAPPVPTPSSEIRPSPTPTANATPALVGKFRFADLVVVTGAGDCLNVRVAPGRTNDAIVCLQDGKEVTISGGPEIADGFRWWKVKTPLGEGWAAEDFMTKKP